MRLSLNVNPKPFIEKNRFIETKVINAGRLGLQKLGNDIYHQSLFEVPVDTGTLKSTAYITPAELKENILTLELGYASPQTDLQNPANELMASQYAVLVHQSDKYQHDPPTKWHFLSDPVEEVSSRFLETLSIEIEQALGRGG